MTVQLLIACRPIAKRLANDKPVRLKHPVVNLTEQKKYLTFTKQVKVGHS